MHVGFRVDLALLDNGGRQDGDYRHQQGQPPPPDAQRHGHDQRRGGDDRPDCEVLVFVFSDGVEPSDEFIDKSFHIFVVFREFDRQVTYPGIAL